jgi:hypothetical protein
MTSETQVKANRENAQKSSGPRTKAGKAKSSQNARKHGLYAKQVVTPGEDPELFEAFRQDLHANLKPVGPLEELLAERITVGLWRLRRVPEIEAALFEHSRYSLARDHARRKVSALRHELTGHSDWDHFLANNEIYTAAKEHEKKAEAALNRSLPFLGATFITAEPMLSRLTQIAAVMEASVYRALKELKRLQDERGKQLPEAPVIEVHDANQLPRRSREIN